jgi:6-pyruvoyltetrahydropterin/6-carboxytetrahydropterin synthase
MLLQVKHNFETAHRLPFLENKCANIHGHSWKVTFAFEVDINEDGIAIDIRGKVFDFGRVKKALRDWIDAYLDHGAMLGVEDALTEPFQVDGCKVYIFGQHLHAEDRPWPTVEAVAQLLYKVAEDLLEMAPSYVELWETDVNGVIYAG